MASIQDKFRRALIFLKRCEGVSGFVRQLQEVGVTDIYAIGPALEILRQQGIEVRGMKDRVQEMMGTISVPIHSRYPASFSSSSDSSQSSLAFDLVVSDFPRPEDGGVQRFSSGFLPHDMKELLGLSGPELILSMCAKCSFPLVHHSQWDWFIAWCRNMCPQYEMWRDYATKLSVRGMAAVWQKKAERLDAVCIEKHGAKSDDPWQSLDPLA